MRADLRCIDPAGTFAADLDDWLPDWADLQFSANRDGTGTCTFTYPLDGLYFDRAMSLQVITVLLNGVEGRNARFIRRERETNLIGVGKRRRETSQIGSDELMHTLTFQSLTNALNDAQFQSPDLVLQTKSYTNAKAGTVLNDLIGPPAARGALAWWGYRGMTFSTTTDSNGTAWPGNITATFGYGQPVLQVMDWLRTNGYIEYGTDRGKVEAWVPTSRGANRADTGTNPVVLWAGEHISDAPESETMTDYATDVTVIGDHPTVETSVIYVQRAASSRPLGRRERAIRVNGVSDTPTLQGIGDKFLAAYLAPRNSRSYKLTTAALDRWNPLLAYEPADTIAVSYDGLQHLESVQVVSGTWGSAYDGEVIVTVNDWLDDRDERLDQLLARLGGN
jgi:hypothetical protein